MKLFWNLPSYFSAEQSWGWVYSGNFRELLFVLNLLFVCFWKTYSTLKYIWDITEIEKSTGNMSGILLLPERNESILRIQSFSFGWITFEGRWPFTIIHSVYINSIFQKSFKIKPFPLFNLAAITSEPHKNF